MPVKMTIAAVSEGNSSLTVWIDHHWMLGGTGLRRSGHRRPISRRVLASRVLRGNTRFGSLNISGILGIQCGGRVVAILFELQHFCLDLGARDWLFQDRPRRGAKEDPMGSAGTHVLD
ncbi:hypothetical protein QF001_003313 [Paraburkholderia youngii]